MSRFQTVREELLPLETALLLEYQRGMDTIPSVVDGRTFLLQKGPLAVVYSAAPLSQSLAASEYWVRESVRFVVDARTKKGECFESRVHVLSKHEGLMIGVVPACVVVEPKIPQGV